MQATEMGSGHVEKVMVSGLELELWTGGRGQTLLFLHPGSGFETDAPFLDLLACRYEVLAPSHPGFGATELPPGITTVDDLSYFYLDFLREHNLHDVILVGVSFGAWIAAEIATKCSDRLAALMLFDAVGAKFGDRTTREITDIFSLPLYEVDRLLYHDTALQHRDFSQCSDDTLQRLSRNNESLAVFAWAPTLYSPKLRQRLHRIDVPTHVVWGEHDQVVSTEYGRSFADAIAGATFEIIPDSGHYPHIEQPERFAGAVTSFIDRLPVRQR
jgi:pimeloyl-ACP methyl ester carboxylesterase